jgi:hypothetical protein
VGRKGWLLSAAAAAAIALAVVLVVSGRDSDATPAADKLVAGQIYSTDAGDPVDVVYEIDESGTGCMSLIGLPDRTSGIPFGGSPPCLSLEDVDEGGMYRVLLPASVEDPALVVGVMPHSATGATVSGVGRKTTRADIRGRWFLALLEPAAPHVLNLEPLRVEFDY